MRENATLVHNYPSNLNPLMESVDVCPCRLQIWMIRVNKIEILVVLFGYLKHENSVEKSSF
jgi:hypothetical protein